MFSSRCGLISKTLALFWLTYCGWAQAQDSSQRAIEQATRRIEAHDFQGASAVLKRAVAAHSGDASLWNLYGISEGELGRTAASRVAFEHGLQLLPSDISLNENMGLLCYREDRYADAKRFLQKAMSLGSANPGAAFSLAAAKLRTGERAAGVAELKKLEPVLVGIPDYWDERGWAALPDARSEADQSFARALALAPDDVRALNGAARLAELESLDEKALSFLIRAKAARPNDVDTLVHLGAVCLRRDLTLDAAAALERAHTLEPANNSALYLYARSQIGVQQWEKAYDLFGQFSRRVPQFAPTYYALGWLDVKLNRPADARKNLQHCLAISPLTIDARVELAKLDVADGVLDPAERALRSVLRQEPGHAPAHIAYGDILQKRGDSAGAAEHYRTAIRFDPDSGPAHYKLSTALQRLNQPVQAQAEREIGTRLNEAALKISKTVLRLASPDGSLLSSIP